MDKSTKKIILWGGSVAVLALAALIFSASKAEAQVMFNNNSAFQNQTFMQRTQFQTFPAFMPAGNGGFFPNNGRFVNFTPQRLVPAFVGGQQQRFFHQPPQFHRPVFHQPVFHKPVFHQPPIFHRPPVFHQPPMFHRPPVFHQFPVFHRTM